MKRNKLVNLSLCALFTALTAVGAFIKIPVPVVPFTLQLMFTTLSGLLLGARRGATSVLCYIAIGLIGLPVFAEGGGIGYILKPSFGYLLGFAVGSFITGYISGKAELPSMKRILAANFAGLGSVYFIGMIYYYIICNFVIDTPITFWPLFLYCFLLAVPGDIVICIVCALMAKKLIPIVKRLSY